MTKPKIKNCPYCEKKPFLDTDDNTVMCETPGCKSGWWIPLEIWNDINPVVLYKKDLDKAYKQFKASLDAAQNNPIVVAARNFVEVFPPDWMNNGTWSSSMREVRDTVRAIKKAVEDERL